MLTSFLGLAFIVLEVAMHFTRAESKHSYTVVNIYEILEKYVQCNNGNNRNGSNQPLSDCGCTRLNPWISPFWGQAPTTR